MKIVRFVFSPSIRQIFPTYRSQASRSLGAKRPKIVVNGPPARSSAHNGDYVNYQHHQHYDLTPKFGWRLMCFIL